MTELTQKIGRAHSLEVEIRSEPDEEIRSHLRDMVLGTPGKLQYRFREIDEKISTLKNCRFLILKKSGRVIGSVCMIRRLPSFTDITFSAWYIRYVYIKAPLKPKTFQKRKKKKENPNLLNIIWQSVLQYLEDPEIMVDSSVRTRQSMLYSYVQKSNLRAFNFNTQVGLLPVRTFKTFFFSRIKPQHNPSVRQIREGEKEQVTKFLREFYKDFALYFEYNLYYKDHYFVFVENNEIVAGMQANPETWEFQNKPGFTGFILTKVLPSVPLVSRYLNLRNFRFIAAEGIFYKKGHEEKLVQLMESVCAIHQMHIIFYWADIENRVSGIFSRPGVKGFLSRFLPSEEGDICAKFINREPEEINQFKQRPVYISCFDST